MLTYRSSFPLVFAVLLLPQVASADWASDMVSTTKIDFGVIATGSEAKKLVEIKNVHNYTVRISDTKTTCGCSAATAGQDEISPGQSAYVEVKMNTQKFQQRKDSNLIINLRRGNVIREIRIPITAYIRSDVVFKPGAMRFGTIDAGTAGKAVVDITYAGRPDWDIEDVKITNPNLKATLSAPARSNGLIKYRLTMTLSPETRVGRLRDLVTLVTNDARNPYVPLMVEGAVVNDFTIQPNTVNVGSVAVGQKKLFQVIVKSTEKQDFRIEKIDCPAMPGALESRSSPPDKSVQRVAVEFIAPDKPGKFSEFVTMKIRNRERPLQFRVSGTIVN